MKSKSSVLRPKNSPLAFFLAVWFYSKLLLGVIIAIFLIALTGCKVNQPTTPTYEDLKRIAEKDSVAQDIPLVVIVPDDSTELNLLPELMPVDQPVYQRSKSGRVNLKITKRIDKSLDVEAFHNEYKHQDTVKVKVPQFVIHECKVDGHISRDNAEKMCKATLEEYLHSQAMTGREILGHCKNFLWLTIGILILLIIFRYFPK